VFSGLSTFHRIWGPHSRGFEEFYLLCRMFQINRCFWGTCRLHLQCRRINVPKKKQRESGSKQSSAWFILLSWRWRRHISPKRRLTFNGLHDVISQKTELLPCFVFFSVCRLTVYVMFCSDPFLEHSRTSCVYIISCNSDGIFCLRLRSKFVT
jgi:hypothetical protein